MHDIDFLTCSMNDVIARSMLLHPSLLLEHIAEVAKVHGRARDTFADESDARDACEALASAAWDTFCRLRDHELVLTELGSPARNLLFAAAARLQCVHYNLAVEISRRG